MYRISHENSQLLASVRGSQGAYRSFRESAILPSTARTNGNGVATSALQAMEMNSPAIQSELPITVTITLTTVLWPGKAH